MTELLRHDPNPKVRRAAIDFWIHPVRRRLGCRFWTNSSSHCVKIATSASGACIAGTTLKGLLVDRGVDADVAEAMVEALTRTLDDNPSCVVRYEAVELPGRHLALGWAESGRAPAIAALVRAVGGDPEFRVRARAAIALQDEGDAVPGLLAVLRTAAPEGRASAADVLSKVGGPGASGAVPDLFTALAHERDADVRAWIASTLFFLIDRDEVAGWIEPLLRALRDSEPTVRTWIAELTGLRMSKTPS